MTPPKNASKSKKNPDKVEAEAGTDAAFPPELATVEAQGKLVELETQAEAVVPIIRPRYYGFKLPSGQDAIIRKIPLGPRDAIVDYAHAEGEFNPELISQHAIGYSLIYPQLPGIGFEYEPKSETFMSEVADSVGLIDVDDFHVLWEEIQVMSYGKGRGKLVAQFRGSSE